MKVLQITDQAQYDNFVSSAQHTSFLQSWQWGHFQNTAGKSVVRYGFFDGTQELIATAQFLKTTIPKLGGFYLYCPRGPVGIGVSKFAELLNAQIKTDFPDAWFVKYEPIDQIKLAEHKPSNRVQPGKTLVTNLEQEEQELLTAMHHKTRYNIKVANKHGITTRVEDISHASANDKLQVLDLLVQTSGKQGYKNHPRSYFENLFSFFSSENKSSCDVKLATAWQENSIAACAVLVDFGETRTYLFGGSDYELRHTMAPFAMHWQAILNAKSEGLKNYDWWGIETSSGKTPGFVRFKLGWSGRELEYPEAFDTNTKPFRYTFYSALKKITKVF